ncbi:hypothetical protein MCM47_41300, partial [Kitasatospora sp. A2-31]|nr:hypothetical protein [Kitasatospora sp. A2-31]
MAKQDEGRGNALVNVLEQLPTEQLLDQTRELAVAAGERAMAVATDKVGDLTDRLLDYVENGGSGLLGGGDGGGGAP